MKRCFVISARRSAVAPRNGAFAALELHALAAPVIASTLETAGVPLEDVGELIVSNGLGAGGNPARICALGADLPERVAGLSIDRQCCGGLDALILGDAMIRSGLHDVVLAGGVESYSRRPLRYQTFADGSSPQAYSQASFTPWPDRDPDMAEAADALARKLGISRAHQDAWAIESHKKALASREILGREIVPIEGLDHDSFARALSPRLCARARTMAGSVTAANMSVAADAAAFCLLVSEDVARGLDLSTPVVELMSGVTMGGDPTLPGLAPVAAIEAALQKAHIRRDELKIAEIMEAFAVQAIACQRETRLDPARVNPCGGSLARGHPIGASGAILAVHLFHHLSRSGGFGLGAIAAAGGLGTALVVRSAQVA